MGRAAYDFLYTNIGRGHPYYLDGIVHDLPPERVGEIRDVFEVSSRAERAGWIAMRALYRRGPAWSGPLYGFIRGGCDFRRPGSLLRVISGSLRRHYLASPRPLVVAHPMLVGMLAGKCDLIYQHGEMVVPPEAIVPGASHTLVPTTQAADTFIRKGIPSENIFVSGLCIEPDLLPLAHQAFSDRLNRIRNSDVLTGAFFSSGAEPPPHVRALVAGAMSVVHAGGSAWLFARNGGRLSSTAEHAFRRKKLALRRAESLDGDDNTSPGARLCLYSTREELAHLTAAWFPQFDYVVAPSHERTNWGAGLGLPMFVVEPPIGTFSPLNTQQLLRLGAGEVLHGGRAAVLAQTLNAHHKEGRLERMAHAGFGHFDIEGFRNIAEYLTACHET